MRERERERERGRERESERERERARERERHFFWKQVSYLFWLRMKTIRLNLLNLSVYYNSRFYWTDVCCHMN